MPCCFDEEKSIFNVSLNWHRMAHYFTVYMLSAVPSPRCRAHSFFSPRASRGWSSVRGRAYYVNPPWNKTIISRRYNDYWVFSSLPATPVQEWEHFSVAWREPGSAERWIETYRGRAARGYCLLLIILTSARCAHPSSPLVRALAPTLLISIRLTSTLLFKCQSHLDIWFVNHIWRN